jgi:4-amino-4-deoxy-L-arabinose transferase-like glycosyltransferase
MSGRSKLAITTCATMLGMFYLLGWFSSQTESPTLDEPLHAVAAYEHFFEHDFRADPEDPPLWQYWAMIPHHRGELLPGGEARLQSKQLAEPSYAEMLSSVRLFQTPGNDGTAFINSSRMTMLLIGVMLGAAIAAWTWQLAGPIAAVFACALFAFDPNFLAHSPLVKNDVSLCLVMFCAAWAAWSVGKAARWWNVPLLCGVCAIAAVVKFSGVIVLPIVAVLLLIRAARSRRFLSAIAICAAAILAMYCVIWASYGFRFDPTPTPGERFDTQSEVAKLGDSAAGKLVLWAESRRLLPQAWLFGLVHTYRTMQSRPAFLLGRYGENGWWYYFPLAMLFKTPLATLGGIGMAIVVALSRKRQARIQWWAVVCLALPLGIYGCSALSSHLNLGIRHVLPLYPFIYVLIAVTLARLNRHWILWILGIALAVETLAAFPHYISFFNAASRPWRLELLSDSNFDWGQDLPAVAAWQEKHPTIKLYLGYFGTVDPAFYGIRYTNLPGGFFLNREFAWPSEPGVVAISATLLQGAEAPPNLRAVYAAFGAQKPREILGDTIYLYDWPMGEMGPGH